MNGPHNYIIVTGSREYHGNVLDVPGLADWLERRIGPFTLIHGDCRGFDRACALYVRHVLAGFATQLPVPMLGFAGQDRNEAIAVIGATLAKLGHLVEAYAYLQDGHPCVGTLGCIKRLEAHYIPVSVIHGNGRPNSDRILAA